MVCFLQEEKMEEKKIVCLGGTGGDYAKGGIPENPREKEGFSMLRRMNESHGPVTEWALGF